MINAFAALEPGTQLVPYVYEPEPLRPTEVEVQVDYCGICHSDLHLIDGHWPIASFPLIPGHEICGRITDVGSTVERRRIGERVGVGWQAGSCGTCEWCLHGEENCCAERIRTCVGRPGGFATHIRLDERFAFPLPASISGAEAAPLLCAGITTFAPLVRYGANPTSRVGVIGLGGLGHLAVLFAAAVGSAVWVLSHSPEKEADAEALGAHRFMSTETEAMERHRGSLDLILSTTTAQLDWTAVLGLLRPNGTLCFLGGSSGPIRVTAGTLISGQRRIAGSAIGGQAVMHEMLRFAAQHGIRPWVETVDAEIDAINAALDRVRSNRARYRLVIEMHS